MNCLSKIVKKKKVETKKDNFRVFIQKRQKNNKNWIFFGFLRPCLRFDLVVHLMILWTKVVQTYYEWTNASKVGPARGCIRLHRTEWSIPISEAKRCYVYFYNLIKIKKSRTWTIINCLKIQVHWHSTNLLKCNPDFKEYSALRWSKSIFIFKKNIFVGLYNSVTSSGKRC